MKPEHPGNVDFLTKIANRMVDTWKNEVLPNDGLLVFDDFKDFANCWIDQEYNYLKSHPWKDEVIKIAESKIG